MNRFYLTFVLILIQLIAFSIRPTHGIYIFIDPISETKPIWKQKSYYPFLEKEYIYENKKVQLYI
jgi:hypothetical protein